MHDVLVALHVQGNDEINSMYKRKNKWIYNKSLKSLSLSIYLFVNNCCVCDITQRFVQICPPVKMEMG